MKIFCTPLKPKPSENSMMATFVYITDSYIAVSLFTKEIDRYACLCNVESASSISIDEFNDYIRLRNNLSIKDVVCNNLRRYAFGYRCKLSDISKNFPSTDDTYLFFGMSILSYEDMLDTQDFSMYQCGYTVTEPCATQFFQRFAESKATQSTLYNWECSKQLISTVYYFVPSASLPFASDENTLLLMHLEHLAVESTLPDLDITNIPVTEKWFYKRPKYYFPDISIWEFLNT